MGGGLSTASSTLPKCVTATIHPGHGAISISTDSTRAATASTKPGFPSISGPGATTIWIPTGRSTITAIPPSIATGVSNANPIISPARDEYAFCAGLPPILPPTTGYGRIPYDANAALWVPTSSMGSGSMITVSGGCYPAIIGTMHGIMQSTQVLSHMRYSCGIKMGA